MPETQFLATVQAATIRELARATTDDIREILADISVGLTKSVALAAPKIFQLNQRLGQAVVVKLLVAVLRAFIDSVRVPVKPDAADIMEMADTLAQTYTHDSIKDVMLALKEARTNGTNFYQALDAATIYGLISGYFDRKAAYLETRHLDLKVSGPSQDAATVASIAAAGPATATILLRRLDPAHPNHDALRRRLSITKARLKRGTITPQKADEQRDEVVKANYHHAARRPTP